MASSAFIYQIEAALEKNKRLGYRLDVIISGSPYPAQEKVVTRWSSSFVEPTDAALF